MTSLRASVPVLRDRFTSFTRIFFGSQASWNQVSGFGQANGWLFIADEYWLYASRDGVNFRPIYEHGGDKLGEVAYGGEGDDARYVFVWVSGDIHTSEGPNEYFNWNLQSVLPAAPQSLLTVHFDGTYFIASGEGGPGDHTPAIQRALPPASSWENVECDPLSSVPITSGGVAIHRVRSGGGKLVIVGYAEGDFVSAGNYVTRDVIEVSEDNGGTWESIEPPGFPYYIDDGVGLTELEYIVDRFVALSSSIEAELGEIPRFFQAEDPTEPWDDITDRLVSPFRAEDFNKPQGEIRNALFHDNGRVVVLLTGWDLQIGAIGADGPDEFERVGFANYGESEKGMFLFKGNYYMTRESEHEYEPCNVYAFEPRVPFVE